MTPFAQALSLTLLHFIWEGIAVGALLWIALYLLRRRSAAARYAAGCLALAALTLLPAVTMWVIYARSTTVPVYTLTTPSRSGAATIHTFVNAAAGGIDWMARIQAWALPVWSIGVLLLSVRLLWGARQVYRLRRRGTPGGDGILAAVQATAARLGVSRRIEVLISAMADGPTVIGWIRPVILLPASTLIGLTPEQLEAVLAHELAHIRRHDYLVNLLQMVVETLLFYHPVVWWTSARIRQERELCCDDLAVRWCGDALCYARALTVLERMRISTPEVALGGAGDSLRFRILRLVGAGGEERRSSRLAGAVALCLALVCFGLNTHWARGQQPEARQGAEPMRGLAVTMAGPAQRDAEHGIAVNAGGAQVLHREAAEYPRAALEKGIQGTVVVETTLDAAGNVVDAHVVSGPTELRKAALESALSTHFVNQAAGSTRQMSFTFAPVQAPPGLVVQSDEDRIRLNALAVYSKQQQEDLDRVRQKLQEQAAIPSEQPPAQKGGQINEARVQQWRKTIEDLTVKLAAVTKLYRPDMPQVVQLREQIEFARQQLQKAEDELQASQNQLAQSQKIMEDVYARQQMELELHAAADQRLLESGGGWAGQTGDSIVVYGLSDSLREDLLTKLPVHQGDTLAVNSMGDLKKAVHEFDEHLTLKFGRAQSGGVVIQIAAPGAAGQVYVFKKDR